jgi:ubiquinone/menaquinone biosynthesis C-methylase UbiE
VTVAASPRPTDFDRVAAAYDASLPSHVVEHYLRKRLAFIRRHTRPGPTLDVGCGTGRLAERHLDVGYRVVGVDLSQGMLRVLGERRPELPRAAADGSALPRSGTARSP